VTDFKQMVPIVSKLNHPDNADNGCHSGRPGNQLQTLAEKIFQRFKVAQLEIIEGNVDLVCLQHCIVHLAVRDI
jgi:hypothetical protein